MSSVVMGGSIVVAIGFYWLRLHFRVAYGVIELIAAIAIITLTTYPQVTYLAVDVASTMKGFLLMKSVGLSAGIYVLVRALDNIEQGLPPFWKAVWLGRFGIDAQSS